MQDERGDSIGGNGGERSGGGGEHNENAGSDYPKSVEGLLKLGREVVAEHPACGVVIAFVDTSTGWNVGEVLIDQDADMDGVVASLEAVIRALRNEEKVHGNGEWC